MLRYDNDKTEHFIPCAFAQGKDITGVYILVMGIAVGSPWPVCVVTRPCVMEDIE